MNEFRPSGFQVLPVVIKNLLIINVLVLLAQMYLGEATSNWIGNTFALHYFMSPLFRPWQLITYMFMHGGWGHLISNMFVLWMFGSILENIWGAQRFLIFYIICGMGAALCQMLYGQIQLGGVMNDYAQLNSHFTVDNYIAFASKYHLGRVNPNIGDLISYWQASPSNPQYIHAAKDMLQMTSSVVINESAVGASGSIFGVLVAFGYLFPNTYLYFYFLFPIKAKWFVIGYILLELYMAIQNNAGDNVAHAAHLGGGLFGFLIVYFWNKKNRQNFY